MKKIETISQIAIQNCIFAMFDEGEFDYECKQFRFKGEHGESISHKPEDLEYHTSWDWIMPIIEKMYKLGYSVDINSGNRRIWIHRNDTGLMAGLPEYDEEFRGNKSSAKDLTPVGCAHTAIYGFLVWQTEEKIKTAILQSL